MAKGIVSPFHDGKPKPRTDPSQLPVQQKGSRQPEQPLPTIKRKSRLDLDGDSYIVRFWDIKKGDIKEVVKRLGLLLYAVKKTHEEQLYDNGVYFESRTSTWVLQTPSGEVCVAIPEGGTAVDAYRRLGYALMRLGRAIKPALETYGVQVIERG